MDFSEIKSNEKQNFLDTRVDLKYESGQCFQCIQADLFKYFK